MTLTAKLALSQIKVNSRRSIWTLAGIVLCVAAITAVAGFAASGMATLKEVAGRDLSSADKRLVIYFSLILGGIIAAASIIVISNAFRVSASERTRQFGILKSVGATKRQITATIMYESLFMCAIGIPVGVIAGVILQLSATGITNAMLAPMQIYMSMPLIFRFTLSFPAIAAAAAGSFVTVTLSAYFPARKAAKITAIDAIRRTGDVKLKRRAVRTPKFINRLFGFEGTLASKSIKRSRRNFRATIVSLSISIILFMAATAFGANMSKLADMRLSGTTATAVADYFTGIMMTEGEHGIASVYYETISTETAQRVTDRLRQFNGGTKVDGAGSKPRYTYVEVSGVPGDLATAARACAIITVDAELYAELCKNAGIKEGGNILVNAVKTTGDDGVLRETNPYGHLTGTDIRLSESRPRSDDYVDGAVMVFPDIIHIDGQLKEIPAEVDYMANEVQMAIIAPSWDMTEYSWFAWTDDPAGFVEYAKTALNELVHAEKPELVTLEAIDIAEATEAIRGVANLVMVFIYGFVAMLTLIGLTNVISAISTNVSLRKREFAVLTSVGMTKKGLSKMLNLEAALCGLRSLMFGLPLGVAAAWLVYKATTINGVSFPFRFPFASSAECLAGVFAVTVITMRFAARRMKGGSLIETIREEGGA